MSWLLGSAATAPQWVRSEYLPITSLPSLTGTISLTAAIPKVGSTLVNHAAQTVPGQQPQGQGWVGWEASPGIGWDERQWGLWDVVCTQDVDLESCVPGEKQQTQADS